jgi:hypothetical protein
VIDNLRRLGQQASRKAGRVAITGAVDDLCGISGTGYFEAGTQPVSMTSRTLLDALPLPANWKDQRRLAPS